MATAPSMYRQSRAGVIMNTIRKSAIALGSIAPLTSADRPFAGLDAEEDRRLAHLFRRLAAHVAPDR